MACRLAQRRPSRLISGALSGTLHTFARLAAWVVVTDWPTLLSASPGLSLSVGILISH
jgi:hypothetical protein